MANNVYRTVKDCLESACDNPAGSQRRPLRLFDSSGSLEVFAMDILGPLSMKININQLHISDEGSSLEFSKSGNDIEDGCVAHLFITYGQLDKYM